MPISSAPAKHFSLAILGVAVLAGLSVFLFVPRAVTQTHPEATGSEVALATPSEPAASEYEYSPPVRNLEYNTNLYWGDTHLHTDRSFDAFRNGTRATQEVALRFARGEEIISNNGTRAKLRRPLDFLAVADHSEFLGVYAKLHQNDPVLENWPVGQRWAAYLRARNQDKLREEFARARQPSADPEYEVPEAAKRSIWSEVVNTADRYNSPGQFTAFVAYEWSSAPGGDMLHRNVIFRDGAQKTGPFLPFTSKDSIRPEGLWAALAKYEKDSGGEALAIPHNPNLSNGRMFLPVMSDGAPYTPAYAQMRARWEPILEVTQVKGDSETHPALSPDDEFAQFERWDETNGQMTVPNPPSMFKYQYARSVLGLGLQHEAKLGVNPFKFGMIGSTDQHTALSTTAEDNFFGKFLGSEPSPDRGSTRMGRNQLNWKLGASGLAAVWTKENTRGAIFDAFKRREVYATTGTRITVRLFAGWTYRPEDVLRPDFATIGYKQGVPMGGDLMKAPSGKAPHFMVYAAKDPDGANLDRVQIIKGWVDSKGEPRSTIYDVALSGGRKVDPRTGKAPPVGNTVNIADASYINSIGAAELSKVWVDPKFDPKQRAFYYVRVIEIPTPRWSAFDVKLLKAKMAPEVPMLQQERAYTSPIWYTP